jgi:SAM-dependent methyltransferase
MERRTLEPAPSQRTLFAREGAYKTDTISPLPPVVPSDYSDRLLKIRLDLVRRLAANAVVLDVCCATGQHLISLADVMRVGIGLDFSLHYLERADANRNAAANNVSFACGDAGQMPFSADRFDVTYSLSSLYVIPNVGDAIREMARVLKPGGKCVLDLGNLYSLNVIVARAYHKKLGWVRQYPVSVPAMKRLIRGAGLKVLEHRSFQCLPLWGADRPRLLKPLLLPFWTRLLSKQLKSKMLDEWISSLPVFRHIAFRHVFVCEKR